MNIAFTFKHHQGSSAIRRDALASMHLLASGRAERDTRGNNAAIDGWEAVRRGSEVALAAVRVGHQSCSLKVVIQHLPK